MKNIGLVFLTLFSVSAMAAAGEEIFTGKCVMCHKEGKSGAVFSKMKSHSASDVEKIILRKEKIGGKNHPMDFAGKLKAEELKAVTEFVAEKAGK